MLKNINMEKTINTETRFTMPSFSSPKNWTEDYEHENGNYTCKCYKCKEGFYGYKRRVICKECFSEIIDA